MSGPIVPPLTVSDEADGGSVSGRPITTIEVTSGTLTVSGRTATLATGGGGGSGTVTSITAAAGSGTGTAITTSGTFTFTGGTGITTSVAGTTVTIVADNNGTVTGTGADDRLAVWTSASAIEGDSNLTWDGSTLTVAGAVDFDNIRIDGNTISSTDTNGAIDLSPDGAGVVTMYNAYRFPTAVTGVNDYVLTAQTDGTTAWAEVTATVPDPLQLSAGSAAAPTYSFSGDTNTGMYSSSADILNLAGGGSDFLEMQHDGTATDFKVGTGSGNARITADGTNHLILQTNNGTNSGTITIQTAVNQDILIEPDGSGQISFYTGANAWTIENGQGSANQVLTTDGAGAATWEDAGGGGGGMAPFVATAMSSDHDTFFATASAPYPNNILSSASQTISYETPLYQPFVCPADMDIVNIQISVTTPVAATNCVIGIYSADAATGSPSTKLTTATFDVSTTGYKTTVLGATQALTSGTLYYLCYVRDAANNFVLRSHPGDAVASGFIEGIGSFNEPLIYETGTDNTLPTTTTTANLEAMYGYNVMIALGV